MECRYGDTSKIEELVGKTFTSVTADVKSLKFALADGKGYIFHHHQDCCESVSIDDICGDLHDLEGSPLLQAEEVNSDHFKDKPDHSEDSETWTFYKFATIKGYVTVRWYGTSNGYYSESVDLCRL